MKTTPSWRGAQVSSSARDIRQLLPGPPLLLGKPINWPPDLSPAWEGDRLSISNWQGLKNSSYHQQPLGGSRPKGMSTSILPSADGGTGASLPWWEPFWFPQHENSLCFLYCSGQEHSATVASFSKCRHG